MAFSDSGAARLILDSGRGPQPQTVVLAEACKKGDVLGYSAGWKRALAAVGGVIQGRLIALKDGAIGESIPVSANPVVGGYSGATPGNYIYIAEGTSNGKVTETAPSTQNDANTKIGIALTATTVMFFLNANADSLAP
jgi:hypothetical protein